jgi:hypothetical protein
MNIIKKARNAQMGTYINPGKNNYEMSVNSEIFVDKTEKLS